MKILRTPEERFANLNEWQQLESRCSGHILCQDLGQYSGVTVDLGIELNLHFVPTQVVFPRLSIRSSATR